MSARRIVPALVGLCLLAGCGEKDGGATKEASFGEVLPGSASDAMLPYDTATSAPPLAPYEPVPGRSAAAPRGSSSESAASESDVVPAVEAT